MTDATKTEVKGWMREVLRESKPQVPTEKTVDHVLGCPDCYRSIISKANDTMDFFCPNCGLPLPDGDQQGESFAPCPNCGCEDCDEVSEETKTARLLSRR